MIDREKVIKGLECCRRFGDCENQCPYFDELDCTQLIKADTLELLKEQEPVQPRKVQRYIDYSDTAVNFIDAYDCGNCGAELPDNAKYCPTCGKAVKWDG